MITCANCGTMQAESKFCGKCGKPLIMSENAEQLKAENVSNEEASRRSRQTSSSENPNPNPTVNPTEKRKTSQQGEVYKEKVSNYWNYFTSSLKHPSKNTGEANFTFGLISTIIALILYVVAPLTLVNKTFGKFNREMNATFDTAEVSLGLGISAFIKMLIYMGLLYALVLLITFLLTKNLGVLKSWKAGIAEIGAYNNYIIVGFIIVLIFILFNSSTWSMSLYSILTTIFIMLIPLYMAINSYRSNKNKDAFISFLLTVVAFAVFFSLAYRLFYESVMLEISRLFTGY